MDPHNDYGDYADYDDPGLSPVLDWGEAFAPIVATLGSFAVMAVAFALIVGWAG